MAGLLEVTTLVDYDVPSLLDNASGSTSPPRSVHAVGVAISVQTKGLPLSRPGGS